MGYTADLGDDGEGKSAIEIEKFILECLAKNQDMYDDAFLTLDDVAKLRDLIHPGASDSLVAQIISDERIDHTKAMATVENSTDRISLVSLLISSVPPTISSALPLTAQALQAYYTPEQQVDILKRSLPRPSIGMSVATPDQMLLDRIASLIINDQKNMNAWVDEWYRQIEQKSKQPSLLSMLSLYIEPPASKAKKSIPERQFFSLPVIMPYVATIAREKYEIARKGRNLGTLYQLGSNEYSDFSYNTRDDLLRRNIINGLQVLDGKDLEDFVLSEIGDQPIVDGHVGVCAALLASSPKWEREIVDVEALMAVRDSFYNCDAVSSMISNHMLTAPRNWLEMATRKDHCKNLVTQVCQYERFAKWLGRHAQSTQWGSLSYLKDLSSWIGVMDYENKSKTLSLLLHKFTNGISTKSLYGSGIFYGKVLLSAFPDDPYAKESIRDQVGYIVKRALIDGDMELLRTTSEKGWITPDRIAECIWTFEEFRKITGEEGLDENLIRPFMPRAYNRRSLSEDLGL